MDANVKAVSENPLTDMLMNDEVLLPKVEEMKSETVNGRAKDTDWNIIGTFNNNAILNSIVYDVELNDVVFNQYAINTID